MKNKITTPFFIFNPKSYLYGKELLKLALKLDELSKKYDYSFFVTAPYADLSIIKEKTDNVIVTSQHLDPISPGRGMGAVLPQSLKDKGVGATFLNHAEKPLKLNELIDAIKITNDLNIINIVCANSIEEAKAIALLKPDILLCEPTELIGTGKTSDENYIVTTNKAIKEISPDTLVMQAAGISNADDVYRVIKLGADGTGCTSGIVKADNPENMMEEMIIALNKAKEEK